MMMDGSFKDSLTGAYSRAAFSPRLEEEIARAQRARSEFALVVVDLDHFKSVNDGFGHQRGDRVLREFARRLQDTVRGSDLVFRYGGDEFVLLLPDTDREAASQVVERLLVVVRDVAFDGDPPLSLTASIGVAIYPRDGHTSETLFSIADQRSYQAKRGGRDCAVCGGNGSPASGMSIADSPSRLIERDTAVEVIGRFLWDLASAHSRGVLDVAGDAGCGRSRLLFEVRNAARAQGFLVLSIQGDPALKQRTFAVFLAACHDIAVSEGVPRPALGAAVVGEALARVAERRGLQGLVITLDDVDDIDRPTLQLVRDLFVREEIPRLALATTLPSYGTTRVIPREAPLHLQLDALPLTLVGVRTWLRQTMNWEIPHPLLVWFYEQTGGRPAHIGRGLDALAAQDILVQDAGGGWSGRADYEAFPLHEHTARPTIVPIHNAPATTLAFVGRNEEIANLKQEVAHRLLVLLGPGGTGKSRLAAQAAAECYRQFPDGVFFVSLVALDAPHLLMTAIADAIGISLHGPEEPETRVIGEMADRRTLLVLDNFEHLLNAAPHLVRLLEGAPGVHLLVTSRERLNLPQAVVVEVGGMDYPDDETLEPLEAWDAVQLFLRSASRFFSNFVLAEEQRVFAARICRLVGGMPLAIELASAWVRTFSCEVIAKKIEMNLGFLATDRPDIADRHRHLLAMVESFWFLLSAEEQRVLSRLSVFRGGFDGSAARRIAAASPFFLDGLVGKGYLRWQPDFFRYDIHELLRQYAHEQLIPDEQEEAETLHAAHYLHLVEQHEATLYQSKASLTLIRQERENVRAAWTWAVQHADTERIARSVEGMSRFYDLAGLWQEGTVFEEAFTRLSGLLKQRRRSAQNPDNTHEQHDQIVVGRLLAVYGEFLSKQGKDTRAMPIATRVQEMGRTLAAPALLLAGKYLEGVCSWRLGMLEQSANALETALGLARETRDAEREIDCLHRLGDVRFDQGEMAGAEQVLTLACSMSRAREDRFREARALNLLGMLTERTTGSRDALPLYHRALSLQREIGSQSEMAVLLANIGATSLKRGMFLDADATLSQAMRLYRASGNRPNLGVVMENLGQSAMMQGDWGKARGYLEKAWEIGRELAQESAYVPAYLSLLQHQQGNHDAARVLAVQAIAMAERTGNQGEEAEAQTSLGHALESLGADSDAQVAYERAVALHEQMGQTVMRAEPLAGLVRLALARGDVEQAVGWVEEILALGDLYGTLDPFRVWLSCYDSLVVAGDTQRAREVRTGAATRLAQQAEQVQGGWRMFFQVPSHRRLAGLIGLDERAK